MSSCGIYELVNLGHGKTIFRIGLVKICELYTDVPLAVSLLGHLQLWEVCLFPISNAYTYLGYIISYFITTYLSWLYDLLFCLTVLMSGSTSKKWTIIVGSIPNMSSCDHTNMSMLYLRNISSVSWTSWGKEVPTLTVLWDSCSNRVQLLLECS